MISLAMKWLIVFCVALILQTTVAAAIAINGIVPDLVYIALFVFAMDAGMSGGTFAGFVVGLGLDLYSPTLLGQNALAKTVSGFLVGIFNERYMRTDLLMKLIILTTSMIVHDAIFTAVTIIKTGQPISVLFVDLGLRTLPRVLYTIPFALLFFMRKIVAQFLVRR
jgi:rod shape-determining protein MreD